MDKKLSIKIKLEIEQIDELFAFYRHSYSYFLQWDKFEVLITHLPETWAQVRTELLTFLDTLSST